MTRPDLTIIVPVYNEEPNVARAYEALRGVMEGCGLSWEIVFTDNHSTDRTFSIIQGIAREDQRVRGFRFSRNFGFQLSILAGYREARGRAVIQIDCDLQDPPELIPEFIARWQEGAQVVYGIRTQRREGFVITLMRSVFYRFIDLLSEHPLPHDAGDFRLVDRIVVDEIVKMRDTKPYLRGFIAQLGLHQVGIEYERNARSAGSSKFRMKDLVELALDGILSQSTVPLRIATWTGLLTFTVTLLLALAYLIGRIYAGADWPAGFTTLILLLFASISLNSIFLGIIGEYLRRLFEMSRSSNDVLVEVRTPDVAREEPAPE
jgi:polyisoprenyl-phosphate glycosyltransferase